MTKLANDIERRAMNDVEKRVREVAAAVEWSGDMRINMTRVLGTLRSAVKLLDERDNEIARLRAVIEEESREYSEE